MAKSPEWWFRKILKITGVLLVIAVIILAFIYGPMFNRLVPLATGYGAKHLCSCSMISGRKPVDIIKNELDFFPVSLGKYSINYEDSTTTGCFFGFFKREAVYRKGFGCTLISGTTKEQLKKEVFPKIDVKNDSLNLLKWPLGEKVTIEIPNNIDQSELNKVIDKAFVEEGDPKRNMRSLLVVYNDRIIAERYAEGFDKDTKQLGWSMAKSILNGVMGRMHQDSLFHWDNRAPVKKWANDDRSSITIDDLLRQSSGLRWWENYSGESDVTNMLFNSYDMADFVTNSQSREKPGKSFVYSSGNSVLLSGIVKELLGNVAYLKFP